MAALVMEVVVLLLKIIGLVALLVLPETGVLTTFNHRLETVSGMAALVMEVVVLLLKIIIGLVALLVLPETGVLTTFSLPREIASGTVALVMEVVVLLLKIIIGLVALLVLPETGVLMIFNHLRATVNGLVALVTEVVVRLGAFAAMIANAVTVMIIATRIGTDVSVQQVKAVSQVTIVEMDKAVSGCAVKESANLAPYLKWL